MSNILLYSTDDPPDAVYRDIVLKKIRSHDPKKILVLNRNILYKRLNTHLEKTVDVDLYGMYFISKEEISTDILKLAIEYELDNALFFINKDSSNVNFGYQIKDICLDLRMDVETISISL